MNKNKKYLYSVVFNYYPNIGEEEDKKYEQGFYLTEKDLDKVIDSIEVAMGQCGGKLLSARIIKQS